MPCSSFQAGITTDRIVDGGLTGSRPTPGRYGTEWLIVALIANLSLVRCLKDELPVRHFTDPGSAGQHPPRILRACVIHFDGIAATPDGELDCAIGRRGVRLSRGPGI